MIQRCLILIIAGVFGVFLFIYSIVHFYVFGIFLGLIIGAAPCFVFYMLARARIETETTASNNKRKFRIIYRLLKKETFQSYTPTVGGSTTRNASIYAYYIEKAEKDNPIKIKKERLYYTSKRVLELLSLFASKYHSPDKIIEYFFENANHFPCKCNILNKVISDEYSFAIKDVIGELAPL